MFFYQVLTWKPSFINWSQTPHAPTQVSTSLLTQSLWSPNSDWRTHRDKISILSKIRFQWSPNPFCQSKLNKGRSENELGIKWTRISCTCFKVSRRSDSPASMQSGAAASAVHFVVSLSKSSEKTLPWCHYVNKWLQERNSFGR
jgi:hypothetical protein